MDSFSRFYKKTVEERKNILKELSLYDESLDYVEDDNFFNHIIENFVTTYEVPMGVMPNLLVDGIYYHVPMATEEPSVIAGASHAAKIIERNGGFKVESINREMIGQIIFRDIINPIEFKQQVESLSENIFKVAYDAHPQIHQIGGGLKRLSVEIKSKQFVTLYLIIDTKDAMGANTINTILEAVGNFLVLETQEKVLMRILSNLAIYSLVEVSCTINVTHLKNSNEIGTLIEEASIYASIDPFRCATHNKGIMNGITALMLATGNDTRAIEASAHAYAAITGSYQPLATWRYEEGYIHGLIKIPLQVGTVGGSMNVLPKAKLARKILGVHDAKTLMKVAAALGLAQNFAALYALTTDGINKGHMKLHARSVALQAGANESNIDIVVNHLIEVGHVTLDEAIKFLNTLK